jgi:hypothetical protein
MSTYSAVSLLFIRFISNEFTTSHRVEFLLFISFVSNKIYDFIQCSTSTLSYLYQQ